LSHGGVYLTEALIPGETQRPVIVGDDSMVSRLDHDQLPELQEKIERLADYVRTDALRRTGKYNTVMLAYTMDPKKADTTVAAVLEEHADRWVKVDEFDYGDEEICVLEYLIRLKKNVDIGTMIERLGAGPGNLLRAVELKPMKGLRKRLT
jgi:hypothetical protein